MQKHSHRESDRWKGSSENERDFGDKLTGQPQGTHADPDVEKIMRSVWVHLNAKSTSLFELVTKGDNVKVV